MQNRSSQMLITHCLNVRNNDNEARMPAEKAKPKMCKKRSRVEKDTPSLKMYFNVNPDKLNRIAETIAGHQEHETIATIGVAYRHDKNGVGALFDHQTFQLATDYPTAMINTLAITRGFDTAIRELPTFLKYGIKMDNTAFKFPPLMDSDDANLGLIVIPGVSADSYKSKEYEIRHAAETAIINAALRRGQPVLGICGGSWTLYQAYGGTIKSVEGHNDRGGMPRLRKNDGIPANNRQVHRLTLNPETTLLKAALRPQLKEGETITVNSVHPMAPCEKKIPDQVMVSATALADASLAATNLKKTENSIEAFESKHGTPAMGVLWHPEAYGKDTEHARLLKYMTLAGQRYLNNRAVLQELVNNFPAIKGRLKHQNKLGYNNTVLRRVTDQQVNFTLFKLKPTEELRHIDEATHEIQIKETYFAHHAYEKTFSK